MIGTANSSTILAKRTRNLIQDVKPDTLYVQTNEKWWGLVNQLNGIQTQEELNLYNTYLQSAHNFSDEPTLRELVFKMRFYPWLFVMSAVFSNF